jgi:hypothetical protein
MPIGRCRMPGGLANARSRLRVTIRPLPVSLAAGSRLGPYEILAPIGAGGMGEVYRARDTRLGREVAVKVCTTRRAAAASYRKHNPPLR